MKKKIFLIGNPKSSYITQYIEHVLEPLGFDIYMQGTLNDDRSEFYDFFVTHNVHFIKGYDGSRVKILHIPVLGGILRLFLDIFPLRKSVSFDYIHVQFITMQDLLRAFFARKNKGCEFYASFWGSDLLRMPKLYLKMERPFLNRMKSITCDSHLMIKKYDRIYPATKNRINVVYYGVSLLPVIDNWENKKDECRNCFSIPHGKIVIAIGYNGRWQQQHDKVMTALKSIVDKSKYFIILQYTYGINNVEYDSSLQTIMKGCGFEYKFVTGYLSMDDISKLRIAVDVFINAQTTDAFCNSIKEYMYARTQIISASWLHYPEIDMFPLYMNEFSNFNEIPDLLEKPIEAEKLNWNRERIWKESSWSICREKWADIYGVNI